MHDAASVLVDGPWKHRFVAANGARFHVAESGTGPLVMLLHGFPQMWWAWRDQLTALSEGGYRAVAMDLRGTGASDKPPSGYDVPTLTADVAGVIRSLGASEAVIVGHGIGAAVAWSMPSLRPTVTRAVAALSGPHPTSWHTRAALRPLVTHPTTRHLAFFQLPWFPEQRLTHGDFAVHLLREWSRPGWPDPETAAQYRSAMQVPFAAHSSMEILRWLVRSTPRVDGQRYLTALRTPIEVPVLEMRGEADRCLPPLVTPPGTAPRSRLLTIPDAGHFLPEEAPDQVNDALLEWLRGLD